MNRTFILKKLLMFKAAHILNITYKQTTQDRGHQAEGKLNTLYIYYRWVTRQNEECINYTSIIA